MPLNGHVTSCPITSMLPVECTAAVRSTGCSGFQCHYCDNHRKVECQSRGRVKLKWSSTREGAVAASLDDRLDRRDALQSTSPTTASKATMHRYNLRRAGEGSLASDGPNCPHKQKQTCLIACCPSVEAAAIATHRNANRVRTQWSSSVDAMARTFLPRRIFVSLLTLCVCLSVISASRYIPPESEPPPYSQYYPPYLVDEKAVGQNRLGKSRTFAKAPSVNPTGATRQFLDNSFSGGEISGFKVLRKIQSGAFEHLASPDYRITSDITVPSNAKLEIEPGVRLSFAPRTGISVRGALLANVSLAPGPMHLAINQKSNNFVHLIVACLSKKLQYSLHEITKQGLLFALTSPSVQPFLTCLWRQGLPARALNCHQVWR